MCLPVARVRPSHLGFAVLSQENTEKPAGRRTSLSVTFRRASEEQTPARCMQRDGESELSCREPEYSPAHQEQPPTEQRSLTRAHPQQLLLLPSVCKMSLTHRKSKPLIAETQTIKPNPCLQKGTQPVCPPQKKTYLIWKTLKAYSWLS